METVISELAQVYGENEKRAWKQSLASYVREGSPLYLAGVSLHYLEFLIEVGPQIRQLLL